MKSHKTFISHSRRMAARFEQLRAEDRAALVTFITAGDPDPETGAAILATLPEAGADVIELGMPFTDPMADGPAIQLAGQRALAAGMTLAKVLGMVASFRESNGTTPIVLMGYYNPVYSFGPERFAEQAAKAGVDGVILVDIPPEEAAEVTDPLYRHGIDLIALATPTTDDARLPAVLENASGFLYYVSVAGITGTASAGEDVIRDAMARLKRATDLPVCVGFGIKTPDQAAAVARHADGAVVGSALVGAVARAFDAKGDCAAAVGALVADLAAAVRAARKQKVS